MPETEFITTTEQQQSSCAESILACQTNRQGYIQTNMWHGDVVWCHKVTEFQGEASDRAFLEKEELSLVRENVQ